MGVRAGQVKRLWAWRTPVRTTATPYMGTWRANMRRKDATSSCWSAGSTPWEVGKRAAIGAAKTMRITDSGVRTARTRPSSPEAVTVTSSRLPAAIGAARRGTTVAARTPPTTTS